MSDKKSTQDWSKDWQAIQQQYWNAWTDATRQATGQAPPANTPWHEGLEQWSRMFAGSGKQNETADRLMSSAKNYVALMQSMLAAASGKNADTGPLQAWTTALRDGFNLPGMDAALLNNPMAAMLKGISGQGAQGFEQLSASFAPFLAQAKQEGMSWLQAPAFGYAREHQEHYQKMLAAFADYQEALKAYNALMLQSSQRSFALFEDKLAARAEPGRQIDSMRALYDLWVDAAEEAYAEIALSEEFRKVYGDVVNAQTRVRSQIQQEVERIGTDLGMPTRTELNSVHKRLHDLRREFRNANAPDAAAQIEALSAEVQALKKALAGRQERPAAAVHDASVRKTTVHNAPAKKTKAATKAAKVIPVRKHAAAVAKPRAASKLGASTFNDAISAMRESASITPTSNKPSARKKVSVPPNRGDA
jgi:class III poly(R)-hydroxyalkanoic acid synthase PhaE subunit